MIGIAALAFLIGAARLFVLPPNGGPVPLTTALAGPAVVAALVLGMYVFTRRFTDRAAAAFQREIDTLDSSWPARPARPDQSPGRPTLSPLPSSKPQDPYMMDSCIW